VQLFDGDLYLTLKPAESLDNETLRYLLHSDATITETNSGSYQFWRNKTTPEIMESLKPGSGAEPLIVKPNGTVMNGNTRIKILEERGIDINELERIILESEEKLP
jgi:cell division protein YceG involved in septum cleavage